MTTENFKQRREERLLNDEQTREVIDACDYAVLATADAEGIPYAVPVNPVWMDGAYYFHTVKAPEGRKAANMQTNPNVSLCFTAKSYVLSEWYSVDFASAVVAGKAFLVDDRAECVRAMMALLKRYAPDNGEERNAVQMQTQFDKVSLWKVVPTRTTGKARAAKKWVKGKTVKELTHIDPQTWLIDAPK